jgi:hypothetical protein
MTTYLYQNMELFGAVGISDYSFTCLIDAPTEQAALEWGHEVAREFDERYRLMPCGDRLPAEYIIRNGSIAQWDCTKDAGVRLRCEVGQMPDFISSAPKDRASN